MAGSCEHGNELWLNKNPAISCLAEWVRAWRRTLRRHRLCPEGLRQATKTSLSFVCLYVWNGTWDLPKASRSDPVRSVSSDLFPVDRLRGADIPSRDVTPEIKTNADTELHYCLALEGIQNGCAPPPPQPRASDTDMTSPPNMALKRSVWGQKQG